jgi:PPOX class probable F420-dependent enzyme
MALSTFIGCITGSATGLHIAVLCLWAFMGGLLVSVGNRGGVVGNQAIIAFVVFGRFSEDVAQALGLAALVLTGGLAQVAFLSVVRWPPPLRGQRAATGEAFRALSSLAAASDDASSLPAAQAIDRAEASLASPSLFGDAAITTLRSLVNEAYRLRVQLMAIHALLRRLRAAGVAEASDEDGAARRALRLAAAALDSAAQAIEGDASAGERLERCAAELDATVDAYAQAPAGSPDVHLDRRLAALAGQVRAVASLAPAAGKAGGLRSRRPYRRTDQPLQRLRADLEQLRANMSLQSPVGRHAVRLAVVVPLAALLARELPLSRSYWMVVAAATVLRPEFGATFTRGAERALGTALGVGLAGVIAVILHPAGGATVVIVLILAWAGYSVFAASFAAGFAFITALVVFLLNLISPDTFGTATARLVDTLVGGAIGLTAYALWPTWAHTSAWQSLADLVGSERAYVSGVLGAAAEGRRPGDQRMRSLARRARLDRTTAESTVARSLSEPSTRRIDASQSQRALAAMRRLVQAAHILRLDVQDDREHRPHPQLEPLRFGIDKLLGEVENSMRARPQVDPAPRDLPDIRRRYGSLEQESGRDEESRALLDQLDEMVDAANSLAAAAGLEGGEADPEDAAGPQEERLRTAEDGGVRNNSLMTTFPDTHRDLLDAPVATLATIGSDGLPQMTEIWFLYDEGELKTSLNTTRLKTRNLQQRPEYGLMIVDLQDPRRYLAVRGRVTIKPDEDYAFATKLGAKYNADVKDHDRPGEGRLEVTFVPANIYAVDMGA